MPIILNGTTGITTPGITNTGPFTFQGVVELPAGAVGAPSLTTTGDTNTGIYFPAADTIAFVEGGVEALRINSSAQIAVNTAGTAGAPVITKTDDLNTGIFFPAADTIAFSEGGVESARFDSAGNFGLGVTPSAWGGNTRALDLQYYNTVGGGDDGFRVYMALGSNFYESAGGTRRYKFTSANVPATMYLQRDGSHSWHYAPNGTAGNTISFTQAMTLNASGNLGIGTSSPIGRVEAYGVDAGVVVHYISQSRGGIYALGTQRVALATTGTADDLVFGYGGSAVSTANFVEQMRLDTATGNFGINQSSPSYKLDINNIVGGAGATARFYGNDQSNVRLRLENIGTGGRTWEIVGGLTGANNADFSIYDVTGTATRLALNSTGNLVLQGGTTTANGIGLTFPATQSASTNANTLDDYEEGSWTPTVNEGTISIARATYTKIGNRVWYTADFSLGGTRTGIQFVINGLPFTVIASGWSAGSCYFGSQNTNFWKTASLPFSGASYLVIQVVSTAGAGGTMLGTDIGNSYVNVSGFYEVA